MRCVQGVRYGRYLRILGAGAAAVSLATGAVVGCANGGGDNETIIEAGNDAPIVNLDGGRDVTVVPHDSGHDVSNDFITIGFSDASDGPSFADSRSGDSSFDAGPSFFGPPGSQCANLNEVQVQACGRCGTQTSTCVAAPDGAVPIVPDAGAPETGAVDASMADASMGDSSMHDDAAKPDGGTHDAGPHDSGKGGPLLVWGPFSACTGEIDAGCVPGTFTTQSCGFCGTQMTVCEPDCQLGTTNCTGQVPDGCAPGSVDFQLSPACSDASVEGTQRTCNPACMWDASAACSVPPTTLTIAPTVSGKVGTFVNFVTTQEQPLLSLTTCPSVAVATSTPDAFITLQNSSTTQAATVSVWTSQPAGAPEIDTQISAYTTLPGNETALEHCVSRVTDTCNDTSDPTSCLPMGTYGGLMLRDHLAVVIPAGGSVVIFVQDHASDPGDLGVVAVTARTESFQ
jgi:hypothetical protein